jgi:hypothetical protein
MPLYAVRMQDDHIPVGFFYAASLDDLVLMVDEYDCDPGVCEYHTVRYGAIHWPDAGLDREDDWKLGERDDKPSDDDPDYFYGLADEWYRKRREKIAKGIEFKGDLADQVYSLGTGRQSLTREKLEV